MPVRRWKLALVLPVLAAALFVVGCERQSTPPINAPTAADNATAAADNTTAAADNATAAADNATAAADNTEMTPPAATSRPRPS